MFARPQQFCWACSSAPKKGTAWPAIILMTPEDCPKLRPADDSIADQDNIMHEEDGYEKSNAHLDRFPHWITDLNKSRINPVHYEQLMKTKPKGKAGEDAVIVEMFGVGEYAWVPRVGLKLFEGVESNPNKISLKGSKGQTFENGVNFSCLF